MAATVAVRVVETTVGAMRGASSNGTDHLDVKVWAVARPLSFLADFIDSSSFDLYRVAWRRTPLYPLLSELDLILLHPPVC